MISRLISSFIPKLSFDKSPSTIMTRFLLSSLILEKICNWMEIYVSGFQFI